MWPYEIEVDGRIYHHFRKYAEFVHDIQKEYPTKMSPVPTNRHLVEISFPRERLEDIPIGHGNWGDPYCGYQSMFQVDYIDDDWSTVLGVYPARFVDSEESYFFLMEDYHPDPVYGERVTIMHTAETPDGMNNGGRFFAKFRNRYWKVLSTALVKQSIIPSKPMLWAPDTTYFAGWLRDWVRSGSVVGVRVSEATRQAALATYCNPLTADVRFF